MRMVAGTRDIHGRFTKGFSYVHSKESKIKIGLAHKGIKLSPEHIEKLSIAHKGKKLSPEHRLNIIKSLMENPPNKGRVFSKEWRDRLSESHKGKIGYWSGKKFTEGHRYKLSIASKGKPKLSIRGCNNWNWKGGITSINKQVRNSIEYKQWREAVFKRDNWTCQKCFVRGGSLHPHHIKSFAHYPSLRFKVSNGKTLCEDCHKKTKNYARN